MRVLGFIFGSIGACAHILFGCFVTAVALSHAEKDKENATALLFFIAVINIWCGLNWLHRLLAEDKK